jgi:hypothetical protein
MKTMMMKLGLGMTMVLAMAGCAAEAGDEADTASAEVTKTETAHGGEPTEEAKSTHRDMPMLVAPSHMIPVERTGSMGDGYQPQLPEPGDPQMNAF